MKTIKVFIASSSELKSERNELSDLFLDLNDILEERGIKLRSVQWEFKDSSMGEKRKEDEYLEELRLCDICIVLFWNILGEYTVEEMNVAVKELNVGRLPKRVVVLYKEPAEDISEELKIFKKNFLKEYQGIPAFCFNSRKRMRDQVESVIVEYLTK